MVPRPRVQRQYSGTAGRIENSQVAVHLVYAGERGHAAMDGRCTSHACGPGLPDPERCRAAGLGEDTVFATKPGTGPHNDRTIPGRPAPHRLGDRQRGLRGNPKLRAARPQNDAAWAMSSRWPARPNRPPVRASTAPTRRPGSSRGGPGRTVRRTRRERPSVPRLRRHRPHRPDAGPPPATDPPQPSTSAESSPDDLIPLTGHKIQRLLFAVALQAPHSVAHRLGGSDWPRCHQARSRASRYR
ncbi:transposase [Streptomyces sp. NPDC048428]|uniref:transposase n=1 Tax=Streptomyces sp. NPDC048428 TaxID=3154503 RepID=UPI00341F54F3